MYTNKHNIALEVAVWLADSGYDLEKPAPNTISVTRLIRPVKQLILANRVVTGEFAEPDDIANLVASRMGHAFHDSVERSWKDNYVRALKALNTPQKVIDKIRINPEVKEPNTIPVYLEQRAEKKVGKYTISGKFDLIVNGKLSDVKSTSVYALKGHNDEKYIMQGSLYRWLNPDKIVKDVLGIQFIFTDWSAKQAVGNKNYPQQRVHEHNLKLWDVAQTDRWVKGKLDTLERLWDEPESTMPECSDTDLWRKPTVWKYFANPDGKRSTKNFDNQVDGTKYLHEKGKGVLREVKGEVVACKYCEAFSLCKQKNKYLEEGLLILGDF